LALTVKHNRANHTHENEQFRRVASSLKILFKQKGWTGLLIGNPFNEIYSRFRADAILLYDHGLIIVDFKVYGGTLKLPGNKNDFEMTQWYTESDDDKKRTVVKAGNRFINPFKQLFSYREAFKEVVRSEILLTNLIQESKTCALNIFSGPLIIENNVPKEIPFYKVTQESDLGTFLYDYSSDNTFSKETADVLSRIFNAEDWFEHIEFPKAKSLAERTVVIDENVEVAISDFLKTDASGILVLESMSGQDRDGWVQHILSEALDFNIPQTETWIHSARIGRKASLRLGVELQSLFNTIYGGAPKTLEIENVEQEDKQYEEQLQEVIPIRSDDSIDQSAVIILHEAHLVSRSLHQSELLRFGSGRLLEDLLKFLSLDKTKRKLICIGDPYSLTYGKDTESAINLRALAELHDGKINYYRQQPLAENIEGKFGLRNKLATGIENKLFNDLEYPWKPDDLLEIGKDDIPNYLVEWFSVPFDSEPTNTVMVYSNKVAKKINHWIKTNCLKNGKDLAKNDLLLVNNNINIADETGFGQPTKLYNGMFLFVEEVGESITKAVPLRQSTTPIMLHFTKVKVKCLSIQNKLNAEVWLLNNYFQSEDKLSKEEQIAFRVFVNMLVSAKMKEQTFEGSYEHIQFTQDKEYKNLLSEEKDLKIRYEAGEKVKTKLDQKQREIRKIESKYTKKFKNRILSNITQTDPFVNAVYANYGWSLTVHKCIGSTFTNAIINAYQGENRGTTNAEYYRWLYSGITTTSGIIRLANPQIIHPFMEVHFEDTTVNNDDSSNNKKAFLYFINYKIDDRFIEKIPVTLKENVKGSICELAKLFEPMGYLLESVNPSGEYLTKVNFSIPSNVNKHLIIAFSNKGANDSWAVSSIRIEKSEGENETKINECIEALFYSAKDTANEKQLHFPTDFRGKVYEKWKTILTEKGFNLAIVETHNNQDIFTAISGGAKAKFRVWYRNDGFISQFNMLEKSDERLGENLKKWLIDGN
jgi:hypothetical protein